MAAYYNEIDKYAAEWLRSLIEAGHIAPGDVDERSIRDVHPSDLIGYDQCHFFAGIGVWSHALRLAGWDDARPVWTGSCPCQPFSAAGTKGGFADDRHLWPEFYRLIGAHSPVVVFGEQVASKDGLGWLDTVQADLEGSGYAFGALDLCAAGFGAPHIRQRLFFVADADGRDACAEGLQRGGEHGLEPQDRRPSRLAYDDQAGRGELGGLELLDGKRQAQRNDADGRSETGRILGHADDAGPQGRSLPRAASGWDRDGERAARPASATGVAVEHAEGEQVGLPGRARESRATGGFWHPCDWLPCVDGKARPVEPGTFPLAHGIKNRVGRLRAYGNAIVAPVAAEFIGAYMSHKEYATSTALSKGHPK